MPKTSTKPPVAIRLKQLREGLPKQDGKTVSQTEIGVRIGLDEDVASVRINRYEKGIHTPDFSTLKKLADVFGVPPFFFYVEDEYLDEVKKHFNVT